MSLSPRHRSRSWSRCHSPHIRTASPHLHHRNQSTSKRAPGHPHSLKVGMNGVSNEWDFCQINLGKPSGQRTATHLHPGMVSVHTSTLAVWFVAVPHAHPATLACISCTKQATKACTEGSTAAATPPHLQQPRPSPTITFNVPRACFGATLPCQGTQVGDVCHQGCSSRRAWRRAGNGIVDQDVHQRHGHHPSRSVPPFYVRGQDFHERGASLFGRFIQTTVV